MESSIIRKKGKLVTTIALHGGVATCLLSREVSVVVQIYKSVTKGSENLIIVLPAFGMKYICGMVTKMRKNLLFSQIQTPFNAFLQQRSIL